MTKRYSILYSLIIFFTIPQSFLYSQSKDSARELKRLNAKIDRVRVMVDSLELDNQILLPELMSAFKQAVKSKAQQDSITLVILKRINTLSNKINTLENQSRYMDSTALEIFNKLVLVENKMKDKKKYFGRDEYFNSVIVESDEDLIGQTKNITIVDGNQNTLFGKTTSKMDHSNYAA